jgi:hypothetical protein
VCVVGVSAPDPAEAGDLGEFIDALRRLRMWAGSPSYRALAKAVGPTLRPPQQLAHTTVGDLFKPGRRRLDLDLVTATVRALGLAEPAVAQWRAACVRVQAQQGDGGPMEVLRQLPGELATFTGRDDELRILMQVATAPGLDGRPVTVVVSAIEGTAGVGKTQLALRVAHELVRSGWYTDIQLYVNLRGFDGELAPSDPGQVLAVFLRQLGIAQAAIPEPLEQRAAMFRDQLRGKRALVLLDNAADEEQIRPLLPGGSGTFVLVTSRRRLSGLEGADLVVLDLFTRAEGLMLLTRIVGADRVAAEPEAAGEIVELCGRLPLAVALVASRLRSRPAWSIADLVQRIRADRISGPGDAGRAPWPALMGWEAHRAQAVLESLVDEHLLDWPGTPSRRSRLSSPNSTARLPAASGAVSSRHPTAVIRDR